MITVKKMYDDLDYWIMIGIGDDIVNIPAHRPEYQHLVKRHKIEFKQECVIYRKPEEIAKLVLLDLKDELKLPTIARPTFWRLLWLWLVRKI